MGDYQKIFKAYDIRGIVPDELDEQVAESVGAAFARLTGARSVVTVHDMRTSSAPLAEAFGRGAAAQGADVIEGGLGSTDMLYYASGALGIPGAMVTASHNPAKYNGIKLCRAGARPVGEDTGLTELRDMAAAGRARPPGPAGTITRRDLLSGYADHLKTLVDVSAIRPLTVAVDAGNGMAGHTVPKVFEGLPITLVPLYFELDGTFPNHEANPIEPENLRDLQRAVLESGADIGLAFDGDADRCFVVDERGQIVSPSVLTALIAVRELAREPGATVIYNLITSQAVPEIIAEHGGTRGAHPGRALVHQGPDGGDRRHVRRRALRALLLPRLLVRRLRHAGRAARAGRAGRPGRAAVRAAGRVLPVCRLRRDQQRGGGPGRRRPPRSGRSSPAAPGPAPTSWTG